MKQALTGLKGEIDLYNNSRRHKKPNFNNGYKTRQKMNKEAIKT